MCIDSVTKLGLAINKQTNKKEHINITPGKSYPYIKKKYGT